MRKNKVWFRIATSLGMMFISTAVVTLLSPVDAKAEVPSCIDLSNPTIGDTCYTEVEYNARVENSTSAQSFSIPQVARTGFVIVDTRNFQESRIGTTNGPNVIITRPGTAINIRQAWEQQYRDFTDFYQHTEAEVRARGINFGGMSNIRQRTEEQFNNAINQLTQIQSNSEAIMINGSAQAQWQTWAGVREYTSGGTLRGRIRVYQQYVGTVDRPNQISSNARNQILALMQSSSSSSASALVSGSDRPEVYAEGEFFTPKRSRELTIHVFRRGNEYIRDWSTTVPFEFGSGWTVNVGDMDGDGKADIFATRIDNSELTVHVFRRGNEYIRDWSTTVPFEFGSGWTTQVGDMDGDGKADIFAF